MVRMLLGWGLGARLPLFDDGAIRSNFMVAVRGMPGVSLSHRRTPLAVEIGSYFLPISTRIDRTFRMLSEE